MRRFLIPSIVKLIKDSDCSIKRNVFKITSMIFDQAGFYAPYVMPIKCLFQQLWLIVTT